MISKNTIKLIRSLSQKKYRKKENLFLVEGDKNVLDVLQSKIKVSRLIATKEFISENKNKLKKSGEIIEADLLEIKKTSLLKSPQNCIALCEIPEQLRIPDNLEKELSIYLDGIQDPGNLGTILRIADWFGIEYLFCSPDTADVYNPKVVQASMGSICRTKVIYTNFEQLVKLSEVSSAVITGAFLEGRNIFTEKLPLKTILVVGNEGNGIRKDIESEIKTKIKIPSFSNENKTAESLNVAVATGVICAEFRRQQFSKNYSK